MNLLFRTSGSLHNLRASLTIFNSVRLSIVSPVLGMIFTAGAGVADVTGAVFQHSNYYRSFYVPPFSFLLPLLRNVDVLVQSNNP